jgi:hypothetical protein
MEWVITNFSLRTGKGPTESKLEIDNPANPDDILNALDDSTMKTVLTDPNVIDWLDAHFTNKISQLIIDNMSKVYYPPNIVKLFDTINLLDNGFSSNLQSPQTDQTAYNSRFLGYEYTETEHDFANPIFVRYLLDKHLASSFVCTTFMQQKIPYLEEILQQITNNSDPTHICKLFEMCFSNYNLPAFLKFLRDVPLRQSLQSCRSDVIRSYGPTIAQIYFADASAWSDSPSEKGYQDWSSFLPQWRCGFLFGESEQCARFSCTNSEFCVQHSSPSPLSRRMKRVFNTGNQMMASQREYNEPPESKQQPVRFSSTNRPVTAMNSKRFRTKREGFYFPIIRYSGLYYSQTEESSKYCGKFFFYEPESSYYMYTSSRSAIFATKVHAFLHFVKIFIDKKLGMPRFNYDLSATPPFKDEWEHMKFFNGIPKDIAEKLFSNLYLAFHEMFENDLGDCMNDVQYLDTFLQYRFCKLFNSAQDLNNSFHNIGFALFFPTVNFSEDLSGGFGVGSLDFLDQPICKMGQKLEIDVIVLQHEIGFHDCVTEVLHTGNFTADIDEIPRVETNQLATQLPKIWFPRESGMLVIDASQNASIIPVNLDVFGMVGFEPQLVPFDAFDGDCGEQHPDRPEQPTFHMPLKHNIRFDKPPGDDEPEDFAYF